MRILNIEDNVIKQNDICKVLSGAGFRDVDWAGNLNEGVKMIEDHMSSDTPYDLVITDMWYPREAGGEEEESGSLLIQMIKDKGWELPVIVCSSVRYIIPDILGTVYYSPKENWEDELRNLVRGISMVAEQNSV